MLFRAVNDKMKAQHEQQKTESAASTALVVMSEADLRRAVTQFYPLTRSSRKSAGSSSGGYDAGKTAGAGIALRTGVGAGGRQPVAGRLK